VGGGGAGPEGSRLVRCEIQRGAASSSSSSTTNKRNMRSVGTDISCEEHTRCNSDSAQTTSTSTSSSTGRMRRYRFQIPQHRHHLEDEEAKACAEEKDPSINDYASIVRLKSSSYIFRGKDKGRDLAMTKWKFQR
jgi:hypothetical protein